MARIWEYLVTVTSEWKKRKQRVRCKEKVMLVRGCFCAVFEWTTKDRQWLRSSNHVFYKLRRVWELDQIRSCGDQGNWERKKTQERSSNSRSKKRKRSGRTAEHGSFCSFCSRVESDTRSTVLLMGLRRLGRKKCFWGVYWWVPRLYAYLNDKLYQCSLLNFWRVQ